MTPAPLHAHGVPDGGTIHRAIPAMAQCIQYARTQFKIRCGQAGYQQTLRVRTTNAAEHGSKAGPDQAGVFAPPEKPGASDQAVARVTAAPRNNPRIRPGEPGTPVPPAAQRAFIAASDDAVEILADPDTVTSIPDANARELLVSANTQESRIAGYLNTWKAKVERIGTFNFPRSAELARSRAHPVLEVAITADGELKEVVVLSSSGQRNLDQAAMDILRIAAPFEPFPQPLRADYDVLSAWPIVALDTSGSSSLSSSPR